MDSKLVLVTGAHGFVGRHVARRYAAAGWTVVGLGHGTWSRDEWWAWGLSEWASADVTLESLLTYGREPARVIHCAGSGSVAFSVSHPMQDFRRTVDSTLAVMEYARLHAKEARVVVPSSAAVYGARPRGPIPETVALQPASPYGVHKLLAENLCTEYSRFHGVHAIVVRLFSAFGSGLRKQLLWDACNKLARGKASFIGTGNETRDWLHVEDVATLLMMLAEHASPDCPFVNGGTGQGATVREVVTAVASEFGAGAEVVTFSGVASSWDPPHLVADAARVQSYGWAPTKAWREGVHEYCDWFKRGAP